MLFWLTGLLLNSRFPYPAKHMRSDFRPWSSSSIFLRSWVTGTSFFRDPTYLNPSTTADPRTRGSVRRASGFVQIAIAGIAMLMSGIAFYEKVIKVKADVAALRIFLGLCGFLHNY